MDKLSLNSAEQRLKKWWFDYNLFHFHLQKWYLTQDKCNTDPEVLNWFKKNSATRNTYQPKNCDNLVKYVCQMVSFVLWKSIVIVALLARAVIFTDKLHVSTALSPPNFKHFNAWSWACRKWCEKSSKSTWSNGWWQQQALLTCPGCSWTLQVCARATLAVFVQNTACLYDVMFWEGAGALSQCKW